jgi:hypothetical protein
MLHVSNAGTKLSRQRARFRLSPGMSLIQLGFIVTYSVSCSGYGLQICILSAGYPTHSRPATGNSLAMCSNSRQTQIHHPHSRLHCCATPTPSTDHSCLASSASFLHRQCSALPGHRVPDIRPLRALCLMPAEDFSQTYTPTRWIKDSKRFKLTG